MQNKTKGEIEDMMEEVKKKIVRMNTRRDFQVERRFIEKMIDEGYRVHITTKEDTEKFFKMKFALSELERNYYFTPREDGTYPKLPEHLQKHQDSLVEKDLSNRLDIKKQKKLSSMK